MQSDVMLQTTKHKSMVAQNVLDTLEEQEAMNTFDGFQTMRNGQPLQQLSRPKTPRTSRQHRQLHTCVERVGLLNRLLIGLRSGQTAQAQEKLNSLEHNGSWLQVASPDLTGSI